MKNDQRVTADLSRLDKFMEGIKSNHVARVGILGGNASAPHGEGMTNSEIGLIHEFGSETNNIPARSFLRMPLEEKQNYLIELLAENPDAQRAIEDGKPEIALKILGIAGEQIVKEAFRSGGYGQWQALAASTIKKKGSSRPLIDTGKLIASISSDVVRKSSI